MRVFRRVAGALALALTLLPWLAATPALAHDRREVGKYTFVVGFLGEPAFADQVNGIDLTVTVTDSKQPVEGLEKTLQAEVTADGKTMPVKLRARYNMPGKYAGDFIPTKPGAYTFRFFGTVEDQPVNETFQSGPGRFNDVESTSALQFPDKAPSAAEMARQLNAAQAAAQQAQTFGLIGLAAGVLGLIVAAIALATRPKAPRPAPLSPAPAPGTDD